VITLDGKTKSTYFYNLIPNAQYSVEVVGQLMNANSQPGLSSSVTGIIPGNRTLARMDV